MRNLILFFALIFSLPLAAQIPVNTPFEANTNNALDNRLVQDNLSDTASIVFKYDGMLVYFKDVSQLWTWDGTAWGLFSGGGGTDDQTAAEVPFSPSGKLLSNNAQDAITESSLELVPVILFLGESNSGGQALNTDLTAAELEPQPNIRIYNIYTDTFEVLDIGTNNQINHYNSALTDSLKSATQHGWENGVAQSYSKFGQKTVYIVKGGQGGSRLSQWDAVDTFTILLNKKIDGTVRELAEIGKRPKWYILFSFGINDRIANTDTTAFGLGVKEWMGRVHGKLGQIAPTFSTSLESITSNELPYQRQFDTIAIENNWFYNIPTNGLTKDDAYHWDASGMKTIAERMVAHTIDSIGLPYNYLPPTSSVPDFQLDTAAVAAYTIATISGSSSSTAIENTIGWVDLGANTLNLGDGVIQKTSTGFAGVADTFFLPSNDFEFTIRIGERSTTSKGFVFYADTNRVAETWSGPSTLTPIGGAYVFDNNLVANRLGDVIIATNVVDSAYVKLRKSGNDFKIDYSVNGASFQELHTFSGSFTNLTATDTIWLKALTAITGEKRIQYVSSTDVDIGRTDSLVVGDVKLYVSDTVPTITASRGTLFINRFGQNTIIYVRKDTAWAGVPTFPILEADLPDRPISAITGLADTLAYFSRLTATATLDFPSIAANTAQSLTVTVTGAAIGDVVNISQPGGVNDFLIYSAHVSSANTVNIKVNNVGGSAIDPASADFNVMVWKFPTP